MTDPIAIPEAALKLLRQLKDRRPLTPAEIVARKVLAAAFDVPDGWTIDIDAGEFRAPKEDKKNVGS